MAKDVNELAGPDFLAEVKAAHADHGVALGVTKPAPEVLEYKLAEPLQSLSRSIGRYTLAVVTMADDDAASIAVARRALRPVDDYREGQARRARAGGTAAADQQRAQFTSMADRLACGAGGGCDCDLCLYATRQSR